MKTPPPAIGPEAEGGRTCAPGAGDGEVVLLVEDETPLRNVLRRILEGKGYRVLAAADAEAALSTAASHTGPIQLLLTDLGLPGMRGPELATRLREIRADLRVLYMSGAAEGLADASGPPTTELAIAKPFSMDALARKIREALAPRSNAGSGPDASGGPRGRFPDPERG